MHIISNLKDTDGNLVSCHGGGFLFFEGWYYWYGENRKENIYVSCYKSKDLKNWIFCGNLITTDTPQKSINNYQLGLGDIIHKVNIERPKVIYNKKTKKFVMWMHYENGKDYLSASCAIATSSSPVGPFTYHGHFNPLGYMSRDCTLFMDNQKAYFISASNDNKDLHIYLLNEDYLSINKLVNKLFIGKLREAPSIFKHNDKYFILTSFCTGWFPNQCKYAYSTSLESEFSSLKNIGDEYTYKTQPTYILQVQDKIIYIGDQWGGNNWSTLEEFDYFKSTYAYTYIIIDNDKLTFADEV